MNTPKQRFLSVPARANAWNELVATSDFQTAVDHATLEFVHQLAAGAVYDAQAASHRLDGAKKMLFILLKLGEQTLTTREKQEPDLDYGPGKVPAHLQPAKPTNLNIL